ncbi:MAG: hypothetical protein AAF649_00230 [Verrucomicrobiota bacterium]
MRISEVWSELSPELNHRVLESGYLNDKTLYRKLNREMAKGLGKRPKGLLEMPRKERHALYQPLLGMPIYMVMAQNLTITWLSHEAASLLTTFLDQLGIEHDGKGCAENFPEEVSKAKLIKAMNSLMHESDKEGALFYLSIFPDISGVEWKAYDKALEEVSGV